MPLFSIACDPNKEKEPPSYKHVTLGRFRACALQSFLMSPVKLIQIKVQLPADSPESQVRCFRVLWL
ncbi:hypothetical protein KSP40_PGU006480 [Platanthera guangdongensis]|uniref:Uncharacterized protein n=1 Tax=Platanthera guangdongensis TaxID=2320717 RepID=A0ABR2LSU7_9ASPA